MTVTIIWRLPKILKSMKGFEMKEVENKKFCKKVVYEVKSSETQSTAEIIVVLAGWKILIPSFVCDFLFLRKTLENMRKLPRYKKLEPISKCVYFDYVDNDKIKE